MSTAMAFLNRPHVAPQLHTSLNGTTMLRDPDPNGTRCRTAASSHTSLGNLLPSNEQRVQLVNLLPTARKGMRKKMRLACVPCARAKQGCDALRPCSRCIRKGTPHLCSDREGRPDAAVTVNDLDPVLSSSKDEPPPIIEVLPKAHVPISAEGLSRILVEGSNKAKAVRKKRKNRSSFHSSCGPYDQDDEDASSPVSKKLKVLKQFETSKPVAWEQPQLSACFTAYQYFGSIYHLLFRRSIVDEVDKIVSSVSERLSPMLVEDFILHTGKW
eukprot:TRINITY_DN1530_c0_g1_i3.p1 TRINITY_DN1530_c0_g1~~TRINITY_DN1530_c0_g1_i3.p1  ORF type:complete len:271 (-),score=35.00 TRINITY_DN1530_c0_g1_i3:63-875(-)